MADAIDQLIDDVLVDAYGPDEQLCAFQQAFEDTATFPFAATIAGADIDVTDIDYDGHDHRGLLAACRRDGQRHTVSLLDVVPAPSLTAATRRLIDAYRRWAGAEPLPRPSGPPVRRKRADRATRRKPPATPTLDTLTDHERAEVLIALLSSHPELLTETEQLAIETLTEATSDAVADDVVAALVNIPLEGLTATAGGHRGGYTEPHEAAWQLIETALDPFFADLRRLAALGHTDAAATTAAGILTGLHHLPDPADGSVLAYAGPDTIEHLAGDVLSVTESLGIDLPFEDRPQRRTMVSLAHRIQRIQESRPVGPATRSSWNSAFHLPPSRTGVRPAWAAINEPNLSGCPMTWGRHRATAVATESNGRVDEAPASLVAPE